MAKAPGKAAKTAAKKGSFRDLDPLEQGGRVARDGFDYQDHVAAGKCLDMLLADGPAEVWCEAEDDIVQVWLVGTVEWFEFVQVKGNELGQAWTVPKLCEREAAKDGKGPGRCIAEKSLANDRADEKCRFRLVTCREPNAELAVLKLKLDNAVRTKADSGLDGVVTGIAGRVTSYRSANGNGAEYWVRNTVWECWASITHAESENLCKLDVILHRENVYLAPDQKREVYAKLVQRVFDASTTCGKTNPAAKRFQCEDFRSWLLRQADNQAHPATAGRSDSLEAKLKDAGFDPAGDEVAAAKEQRRTYRQSVLQQRFLDLTDRQVLEMEVQAVLATLKADLDAGQIGDTGVEFHARCLRELRGLPDKLPTKQKPPLGLVHGCMYDVMNRCQHDLARAAV